MKIWPFTVLKQQRKEIAVLEAKLAACGLAARGYYTNFTDHVYSQSLVSIIALQNRCELMERDRAVETRLSAIEDSDTNLNQEIAQSILDLQKRIKSIEDQSFG